MDKEPNQEEVPKKRSGLRVTITFFLLVVIGVCAYQLYRTSPDWLSMSGRAAASDNPFDFSNHSIPIDEIHHGGPPKDGIPAISEPDIVSGSEADFLNSDDKVIGVVINGQARAYPIRLLNYHECVNDSIGGKDFAVTYCPLCDSSAVFDRTIDGRTVEFGISGWLYNSNVLLYDRSKQESLWSQVKMEAVTGPRTGTRLRTIPHTVTAWSDWLERHPDTEVVSFQSGYSRNYGRSPYDTYMSSDRLMFPVTPMNEAFPLKELVIGVRVEKHYRAYPFSELAKAGGRVREEFEGAVFQIDYDKERKTASIRVISGKKMDVDTLYTFWFAWFAMHPYTEIYESD